MVMMVVVLMLHSHPLLLPVSVIVVIVTGRRLLPILRHPHCGWYLLLRHLLSHLLLLLLLLLVVMVMMTLLLLHLILSHREALLLLWVHLLLHRSLPCLGRLLLLPCRHLPRILLAWCRLRQLSHATPTSSEPAEETLLLRRLSLGHRLIP